VGACVVDQHAAVLGAFGILAALHGRERTGRGGLVESNLLNAALDLQIEPLAYALNGFPSSRSTSGVSSPFYNAPYGVFATADGYLCISLTSLEALERVFADDWFGAIDPGARYEERDAINDRIAEHMRARTAVEWSEHFAANKMWFAPVNGYDEVMVDPQVLHNDSFDAFEHETAGIIRTLKHPIMYDGERPGIRTAPPELGQHTREVLTALGVDGPDAEALFASGAVG
jgi:crotonobetainyl-CoA:carnitine CoA-transferase CaiB-like acyl-CoA transferase